MTYYVAELQNLASIRKAEQINAKALTSAKRTASRNQVFVGTVLKLMDAEGCLLAVKDNDGWRDMAYTGIPEMRVA